MVRQNKSDDKSNVSKRASLSFYARQNNSVLVNASADFVEPLIFTNIKIIAARLFYERDYKTFTDFRLFWTKFQRYILHKVLEEFSTFRRAYIKKYNKNTLPHYRQLKTFMCYSSFHSLNEIS